MSRPAKAGHGDYGYAKKQRCPCVPCRKAERGYVKRRGLEKHRGIEARLDPGPTVVKLHWLMQHGAEGHQIAAAAGISHTVVKNILGTHGREPAKHVLRPTAARIAALTLDGVLDQPTWVSPVGVQRRLRALRALGHGFAAVGEVMGVTESMVYNYYKASYNSTTTVDAIDAAYRQLRDRDGTGMRLVWEGRWLNEPTPMCWDDDEIDDPEATPAVARRCVLDGCGRPAVARALCPSHHDLCHKMRGFRDRRSYRETVIRLSNRSNRDGGAIRDSVIECLELHGFSVEETCARVGVSKDHVENIRKERLSAAR